MENTKETAKNSWGLLIIVLLASISAPLAMFKVAAVMGDISSEFALTNAQGGLISSAFSVVPIILAIPVGYIVAKRGTWKLGIAALLCLVVGSVIGILSHSVISLLTSRIIEGVAMCLLATIGPSLVSTMFDDSRRGLAMGIFQCWIAIGQAVMFMFSPIIVSQTGGWRGVWYVSGAYALVFLLIWIIFMKKVDNQVDGAAQAGEEKISFHEAGFNKDLWLVAIAMFLCMLTMQGVVNFFSQFLIQVRGMEMAKANTVTSLLGWTGMVALVLSGIIIDKTQSVKWFGVIVMLLSTVVTVFLPASPAKMLAFAVIAFAFITNCVPTVVYTAIPIVTENPKYIALSTGIVTTSQFVGVFLGQVIFGAFIDSLGWNAAFIFAGAASVLAAIIMIFVKKLPR